MWTVNFTAKSGKITKFVRSTDLFFEKKKCVVILLEKPFKVAETQQ